ncbi:MAG: VWA domain-containing protein [Pirellulaceae bacterium]|nr:VWA domain-containing protein [Planctomycetales bacterium]
MSASHVGKLNARRKRPAPDKRKGAIIILTAILMVCLMAMLAMSIDVGYMVTVQSELDRAVDAGALAGAATLGDGTSSASTEAREFIQSNRVGGGTLEDDDITVEPGTWNTETRTFTPTSVMPSALRVTGRATEQPYFFARVLGRDTFSLEAQAIAMYQPRDIMLVLDYSASMNDDSEFRNISAMGRDAVEANLLQIYNELGAPTYGNMQFAPNWATIVGDQPMSEAHKAHIEAEYRYNSVVVTSNKDIYSVRLYFSSGSQTFYSVDSGDELAGTGSYSGRQIRYIRVYSGYNSSNTSSSNRYVEYLYFNTSDFVEALGLDNVNYPYNSGSWSDYVSYCSSGSEPNDDDAGYRYKFGYMNWMNYLLEQKPMANQTADLWMVSEQPLTAVKDAVTEFVDYLDNVESGDQLGLVIYTGEDGSATLEHGLGNDYDQIATTTVHRQAGHYHTNTNIGAGLLYARQELVANARQGAYRMVILMTDGLANMPNYSTSQGISYARQQSDELAALGIPVVTISLGSGADTDLMQEFADDTGGIHFNIPGGQSVADYQEDLLDVFHRIAEDRPLKLVQ